MLRYFERIKSNTFGIHISIFLLHIRKWMKARRTIAVLFLTVVCVCVRFTFNVKKNVWMI